MELGFLVIVLRFFAFAKFAIRPPLEGPAIPYRSGSAGGYLLDTANFDLSLDGWNRIPSSFGLAPYALSDFYLISAWLCDCLRRR